MNSRAILLLSILYVLSTITGVSQVPKGSYGPVALVGATAYTITEDTIENCTIILRDGKIEAIGAALSVPADARVVDCQGLRVYPGFIDSGTRIGLTEISSDPRTHDYNELGNVVPQMRALTAVNPNSALVPVTRVNGVTTVLSVPSGGLFSGTAALINLYGYTPGQMYAGFEAVVMTFPSTSRTGSNDKRKAEEIKKAASKAMKKLDAVWKKVVEYYKLDSALGDNKPDYYPELIALQPVLQGKMPLIIEVDDAGDILRALEWVREKEIRRVIFSGVKEGWRVADKIAKAGIPVITGRVLSLPGRAYDRYDRSFANAGLMKKAGVKVALRTNEANNVRNLPYNAGFAAAFGLGKEEALRAITIVPAQIFGVADRLGSLEAGKDATLFVCDGDPLEPATNILHLFINGWDVPLVSRQTLLYDEFLHREPGLQR